MAMLFRLLLLAALLGSANACANCGGDDSPDGGRADGTTGGRRDTGIRRLPDGRVVAEDGSVPPGGATTSCGGLGERCCRSGACDLGLRCDAADSTCRSRPGGVPCTGPADCSSGFVCEMMDCRAPDGSTCIGSSDCREGRACLGGTCREPTDGCGAIGGACCTGDVCRAGGACSGGMCERCGSEGGPCCDGSASCGASGALLCLGGRCQRPVGCGSAGETCCMSGTESVCVRGATCMGGSCVMDPAPGSGGSMCGADGQPCCPGDVCAFGTICEPYLTNTCIGLETIGMYLDFDCGEEGELCCIWDTDGGLSFFTCEGDLECDLLFCSGSCKSPSESCTTSSECCDEALCRPAPATMRCCLGPGERCAGSLECCGQMLCADGTCQCRAVDASCVDDSECCSGSLCMAGVCRPSNECRAPQAGCMDASECCRGLQCDTIATQGTETKCCAGSEAGCRNSLDCCGWMLCEEGQCQCQDRGSSCLEDDECCDDDICVVGVCVEDTGSCARITESCDPSTPGSCCGAPGCQPVGSASGPVQCCARAGQPCEIGSECCGFMTCGEAGTCECRTTGQSCVDTQNCCGASVCTGRMGMTAGTCS